VPLMLSLTLSLVVPLPLPLQAPAPLHLPLQVLPLLPPLLSPPPLGPLGPCHRRCPRPAPSATLNTRRRRTPAPRVGRR